VLYQAGGRLVARNSPRVTQSACLSPDLIPTRLEHRFVRLVSRRGVPGRNPQDILFFLYAKVITADTEPRSSANT